MNTGTPDHWHTDQVYLFVANDDPTLSLADGESTDMQWLTRQRVEELPAKDIFPNIRTTHLLAFDHFLEAWEPVPATSFRTDKIMKNSRIVS